MVVNEFLSWRRKWPATSRRPTSSRTLGQPDHAEVHAERSALLAEWSSSRRQRAVLVLRYYEGMSDAQIAEVLGAPRPRCAGTRSAAWPHYASSCRRT